MLRVVAGLPVLVLLAGCGESERPSCDTKVHRLGACVRTWGPDVVDDGSWELTVVAHRTGTDELCDTADSLDIGRPSIPYEVELVPTRGWELVDGVGDRWLIEFAFPSMPQNLLSPGDDVTIAYSSQFLGGGFGGQRGYVTIHRDGDLLAFYARRMDPEDVPGVGISLQRQEALCPSTCGELFSVEMEFEGKTTTLETGERARIGSMQVMNDYYGAGSGHECASSDTSLGAYRVP